MSTTRCSWARPKWRSASASWASPPRFSWTVTASFANASSDSSTLRHSNPPCSSCCKTLVGTLKAWSSTVPFTAHQKKSTLVNKRGACMLHVKQGMVVFVVLLCASFSLQAGPRKEKLRRWEFGGHYTLLNIPSNRVGCGGCRANNSGSEDAWATTFIPGWALSRKSISSQTRDKARPTLMVAELRKGCLE